MELTTVKSYLRVDYADDDELIRLMIDATAETLGELIPGYNAAAPTARQDLLLLMSVKDLYDHREKYGTNTQLLSGHASTFLYSEIYGGAGDGN